MGQRRSSVPFLLFLLLPMHAQVQTRPPTGGLALSSAAAAPLISTLAIGDWELGLAARVDEGGLRTGHVSGALAGSRARATRRRLGVGKGPIEAKRAWCACPSGL